MHPGYGASWAQGRGVQSFGTSRVTLLEAMLSEESRAENRSGTLFRAWLPQACAARMNSQQCSRAMNKTLRVVLWGSVVLLGALALGIVALRRGEPINALWLVAAATCCYALGYRFYSAFIAAKILAVDPLRATPAERLENGRDFLVTNKWVVFGHHFAAIAGPGPLVGPVLAAQFGYLPGTLWVIAGAVFAGCVQDFVILLFSVRRDGKSLTEGSPEKLVDGALISAVDTRLDGTLVTSAGAAFTSLEGFGSSLTPVCTMMYIPAISGVVGKT